MLRGTDMRALIAAILIVLTPTHAFAWGQTGHRVTGEIAEPLLSRRAAREVRAILGNESLAEASTWADEMRSSPEEFWQRTASPWHYVTVPTGQEYAGVGAPPEGDAATALTQFAATLRDRDAPLAERQLALRFAIHIIGDLHQPLHAGNGADRGGNDVQVTFFGDRTNLHAVWDSGMIDRRQLSYTEWTDWLQRRITPSLRREWSNPDPLVWIAESAAIRDAIYPEGDRLSYDYVFSHRETVDRRLSQAGVRIAAYLNWVFG
jgi:hypothetical protein